MGLFDSIASAVGGALSKDGTGEGAQNILGNLLQQGGIGQSGNIVGQLIGGLTGGTGQGGAAGGGMASILEQLSSSGLADQVTSWISNNPNLPISPEQIKAALGSEQVQQMAQSSGLPINDFLQHLAQHLPTAASEAAGVPPGGAAT